MEQHILGRLTRRRRLAMPGAALAGAEEVLSFFSSAPSISRFRLLRLGCGSGLCGEVRVGAGRVVQSFLL